MAEVLRYPTARTRPYNKNRFGHHGDLPENVVRLVHPRRPEPPQRTGLIAFHLLTAMLADMTLPQRHRIAERLQHQAKHDPESQSLADAYELLLDLPWRQGAE